MRFAPHYLLKILARFPKKLVDGGPQKVLEALFQYVL
jgi:hypothetical protein